MLFEVSTRGAAPRTIEAPNWLAALGLGMDELGVVASIDRLACEVLPNGTVLARDARTGAGFVVEPCRARSVEVTEVFESDDSDMIFEGEEPSEDISIAQVEAMLDEDIELLPEDALELLSVTDEELVARIASLPVSARVDARTALEELRTAPTGLLACAPALALARRLVQTEAGSVMLSDDSGALRFTAVAGPRSELLLGVKLPAGTGLAGFCVERGVSLGLTRPRRDPRFYSEIDRVTGVPTESLLCVPIGPRDQTLGCIEMLNPSGGVFQPDDTRYLLRIADELHARMGR